MAQAGEKEKILVCLWVFYYFYWLRLNQRVSLSLFAQPQFNLRHHLQRTIRKMCKQMIWLGVRMWKCVWVCLHSHVKVSILLSHVCLLACDCSLFPLMAFPYFKRCFANKFSEYSEAKIAQFKGMPFISIANICCAFFRLLAPAKKTNVKQRMFF